MDTQKANNAADSISLAMLDVRELLKSMNESERYSVADMVKKLAEVEQFFSNLAESPKWT